MAWEHEEELPHTVAWVGTVMQDEGAKAATRKCGGFQAFVKPRAHVFGAAVGGAEVGGAAAEAGADAGVSGSSAPAPPTDQVAAAVEGQWWGTARHGHAVELTVSPQGVQLRLLPADAAVVGAGEGEQTQMGGQGIGTKVMSPESAAAVVRRLVREQVAASRRRRQQQRKANHTLETNSTQGDAVETNSTQGDAFAVRLAFWSSTR